MIRLSTVRVSVARVDGGGLRHEEDTLAVEEPLEIRVGGKGLSITMRTPGSDVDLAAGFLFSEGIVARREQVLEVTESKDGNPNIISIELSAEDLIQPLESQRSFVMTSACGVCGKESLDALVANKCPVLERGNFQMPAELLHPLPDALRRAQSVFESTGGLHAAGLFNAEGELQSLREDVGRHNAVDKLIGHAFLAGRTPLRDSLMLVSGRASFELVQKALVAGIPILAAVGAPSSLAVSTADAAGLTLIGFLRNGRFNVYTHTYRLS